MDIKVYIKNGSGYTRYPIPPGTYQAELVKLSNVGNDRHGKTGMGREVHQITIHPSHQVLQYPSAASGKATSVMKKHPVEGPMTNLLYLALCCCESSNKSGLEEINYSQSSASFEQICPYLEEYIIDACFGNANVPCYSRQGSSQISPCYCINMKDVMHLNSSVQEAVLIIRNVPVII